MLIVECYSLRLALTPREEFKNMPNPKRRHSQRRTSTRRAHDALKGHTLSECPNCHERKMPHRACPKCGYYKGRGVLDVEEAS
jgi:large subunit ribosomal protein L32